MLFKRANSIVLLCSISLNPAFVFCGAISEKSYELSAGCNLQNSEKVEDVLAKDYCQKLNKHVAILQQFNEFNKKHKIVDFSASNNAIFNVKNIEYKNEIIKICIAKMVEQKSLEPFFKTWDYAYSLCISNRDMCFVREFSIVIFSLYENLLTILFSKKLGGLPALRAGKENIAKKLGALTEHGAGKENIAKKLGALTEHGASSDQAIRGLLEDIIQVYNAVSELPIKEIIVTLEKCYVLFSKILNDYGVGSGLTIKQWIIKYWWLPPTIIIAIIGAFLRKKISTKVRSLTSKLYSSGEGENNIREKY